jgi:hypothetical protein
MEAPRPPALGVSPTCADATQKIANSRLPLLAHRRFRGPSTPSNFLAQENHPKSRVPFVAMLQTPQRNLSSPHETSSPREGSSSPRRRWTPLASIAPMFSKGRRRQSRLPAADLPAGVEASGLTRLAAHYAEIDWNGLLEQASHVDLFFAYASAWRNNHNDALRSLVKREGAHLRVILPDRENEAQVAQLAARFSTSPAEIVKRISGAEQAFAVLSRDRGPRATVELRCTSAFPVFTYYRFDRRCIGVLYTQVNERVRVPAFECERGGTLHTFFSHQFSVLWAGSSVRGLDRVPRLEPRLKRVPAPA